MVLQDIPLSQINRKIEKFIVGELFYGQTPPEKTDKRYYPQWPQLANNRKIIHLFYTLTKDDIAHLNGQFTEMREKGDRVIFEIDTPPDRRQITSYVKKKDRDIVIETVSGNTTEKREHLSDERDICMREQKGDTISEEKIISITSDENEKISDRNVISSTSSSQEPMKCEENKLMKHQVNISNTEKETSSRAVSTSTSSLDGKNGDVQCTGNTEQSALTISSKETIGSNEHNYCERNHVKETTDAAGTASTEDDKNKGNLAATTSNIEKGEIGIHKDSVNKPKGWNLHIQKLYLFHQTTKQRYLLNRYGEVVIIIEIKPKPCGFRAIAVSLFLICVRTNVDCQVVGTVLCNKYNDHAKVLKDALIEFKEINELWKPKYLMIEPSETMVSVVHDLFPGIYSIIAGLL